MTTHDSSFRPTKARTRPHMFLIQQWKRSHIVKSLLLAVEGSESRRLDILEGSPILRFEPDVLMGGTAQSLVIVMEKRAPLIRVCQAPRAIRVR
jgi:hypothetical protein